MRGKTYIVICILLILPMIVYADSVERYQITDSNSGAIQSDVGDFSADANLSSLGLGFFRQPLVIDFDNDGVQEIVFIDASYIYTVQWNDTTDALRLESQDALTVTGSVNPMTSIGDSDLNGYPEIITPINGHIFKYEYNISTGGLDWICNGSLSGDTIETGAACGEDGGVIKCWVADNAGSVWEFNTATCAVSEDNIYGATNAFGSIAMNRQYTPPIDDIDGDGNLEIVFVSDSDTDNYDGMLIYDVNTGFQVTDADLIASAGTASGVYSVILYDIDGGNDEILVTSDRGIVDAAQGYIAAFRLDLSTKAWQVDQVFNGFASADQNAPAVLGDFDSSDAGDELCMMIEWIGNEEIAIACVDPIDGTVIVRNDEVSTGNTFIIDSQTLVGIDADFDGYLELWAGGTLFDIDNGVWSYVDIGGVNTSGYSAFGGDINGDNAAEICGISSSALRCYTMGGADNERPTLIGSYGQDSCGPVCLDTYRTYQARECTATQQDRCNYVNDLSYDNERVLSTCGNGTNEQIGSYTGSEPELSCYFDSVGTKAFFVYIQDYVNDADYTQYEEMNEYIIDGTAGIDCNLPCGIREAYPSNDTQIILTQAEQEAQTLYSEEGARYVQSTLLDQHPMVKAIISILFVAGAVAGLVRRKIEDPKVYMLTIFMVCVGLAIVGFLSWATALFVGLGCIGISFLSRSGGGN